MDVPVAAFFPSEFKENTCSSCGLTFTSVHVPIGDTGPTEPFMGLGCSRCGRTVFFDGRRETRHFEDVELVRMPFEVRRRYQEAGLWERARLIQEFWLNSLESCACSGRFRVMLRPERCPRCGAESGNSQPHNGFVRFLDTPAGIGPNDELYLFARYALEDENGQKMKERISRARLKGGGA